MDWGEYAGRWNRDEFGIPLKPKGEESAQDRLLREAKVREAAHLKLSDIYRRLQKELGGKDGVKARRCFDYFASQKPKYKKGQHGGNDPANERLLELYDELGMEPAQFSETLVKARTERRARYLQDDMDLDDANDLLANQFCVKPWANAKSVERRVRRLLKEREENTGAK
jgi:hypothetical protein